MNLIASLCRRPAILSQLKQPISFPKRSKRRPDISHPALWYEDYPIALIGRRQSPINISTDKCILNDQHMKLPSELVLTYPSSIKGLRVRNPKDDTYFGWRADLPYDDRDKTLLSGGPLQHNYKLVQFHAHWGKNCSCGSEHIINGLHYSAELHFVHWNSDLYSCPRQAAISKDGLAVVAVFLEAAEDSECATLETLSEISKAMSKIKFKGMTQHIEKPLNILELIPEQRSYWTYLGSLTTPPLWETVTWIVFEKPIKCNHEQIDTFRQLCYYSHDEMQKLQAEEDQVNVQENFRPIQPLNGRKVIYVKK